MLQVQGVTGRHQQQPLPPSHPWLRPTAPAPPYSNPPERRCRLSTFWLQMYTSFPARISPSSAACVSPGRAAAKVVAREGRGAPLRCSVQMPWGPLRGGKGCTQAEGVGQGDPELQRLSRRCRGPSTVVHCRCLVLEC